MSAGPTRGARHRPGPALGTRRNPETAAHREVRRMGTLRLSLPAAEPPCPLLARPSTPGRTTLPRSPPPPTARWTLEWVRRRESLVVAHHIHRIISARSHCQGPAFAPLAGMAVEGKHSSSLTFVAPTAGQGALLAGPPDAKAPPSCARDENGASGVIWPARCCATDAEQSVGSRGLLLSVGSNPKGSRVRDPKALRCFGPPSGARTSGSCRSRFWVVDRNAPPSVS